MGNSEKWEIQIVCGMVTKHDADAPGYAVLGRYTACSTEKIDVLPKKIERNHPLRHTPAYYISKVVVMKSEEIRNQKVYVSPRPPQKISYKNNWMCDLYSDVAGSSKDTQRIQPKPKTQLSSTGRPVCGPESTKRCVLTPKHVEEDQTGTGRPWIKKRSTYLMSENQNCHMQL